MPDRRDHRVDDLDDQDLERALSDVGGRLAYPDRDLWPAVRRRITERRAGPWWSGLALGQVPLAPVLVTLLVMLVAVFALSPELRARAAETLGLRGVQIIQVQQTPSPTPSRTAGPTPTPAFQGTRVTLAEARAQAGFISRTPTDPRLGDPDEVYLETGGAGNKVTLVYRLRPGIPVSPQAGLSAIVVEVPGRVDVNIIGKIAGPGTKIEQVTVNGGPGIWLEGEPHQVIYADARGNFVQDTLRLAGNTLLWEQGGVTLRLEAQVSREEAVRIAATFR